MRFLAVIDPNWNTDDGGGGRGAQNHYALSSVDAIAASYRMNKHWRGEGDALVFMWTTRSAMREGDAHVLARLLGLRICSDFIWAKVDELPCGDCADDGGHGCGECVDGGMPPGVGGFRPPAMMGLGFWSRSEHEILLVCRRGDIEVPPAALRPRSVIYAPRVTRSDAAVGVANKTMHSAKPARAWDQVIEPIARACMPGVVGIEWNCRRRRPGWAAFGALDGEDKPLRYEAADAG